MQYKKFKHKHLNTFQDNETDIRLADRLREYRELGVSNVPVGAEIFDDIPNEPTKNMVVDPFKQPFKDPFALSEQFGSEVTASVLQKEAAADQAAAEATSSEAGPSDGEA